MNNSVLVLGGTGFVGEDIIYGDIRNIEEIADDIRSFNPIALIYSIGLIREDSKINSLISITIGH